MTKLDVLAIGAHPDDVELCCGGTLAILAAAGHSFGILHLTRGEAGTRGTAAERVAEAEAAGGVLGAAVVEFLDCGDADLRTGVTEQDAAIEILRRYRPDLVLGPTPSDRHPDHGRAHRLVRDACFYAGLSGRGVGGEPFRPGALFSYMQHDPFDPAFIVDVTAGWERKLESLAEYRSQLYQAGGEPTGPATKVSSEDFYEAMIGRARHYGMQIGARFGEPFWSSLPLAIGDPLSLVPGGIR